jgi:hypothetical protein
MDAPMMSVSDVLTAVISNTLHFLSAERDWHLIKPIGKDPMMQRWNGSSWEYRSLTKREIDKHRHDLV